jgi:4-diphosphocytidyl-2-C-methyl-D-erythritol kinase
VIQLDAPAKINLGLRVMRRRADGYHELESLFLPLDLADAIRLAVAPAPRASVALRLEPPAPAIPDNAENLAARAASAFLEAAGLAFRVEIELTKHTPVAAGLGGGSSDAGAVLRALAERFPDALTPAALASLALQLGADVPFFLDPRPSWVRGVGERLEPVDGLPSLPLVLANPGVALATAEVYRAFDALHPGWSRPETGAHGLEPPDPSGDPERLVGWVENDRLRALGALAVGMSGSGATVFGVFADAAAARAALGGAEFSPPIWGRVATTLESR